MVAARAAPASRKIPTFLFGPAMVWATAQAIRPRKKIPSPPREELAARQVRMAAMPRNEKLARRNWRLRISAYTVPARRMPAMASQLDMWLGLGKIP